MTSLASTVSRRAFLGGSFALSMGLCALHVSAQQATGIIAGKVTDTASAPVSNAMLHVIDSRYGAVSADNGVYRIVGVAPGSYSVVVRRQGFVTDTFTVTIAVGETSQHDVALRSIPISLTEIVVTASPRMNETQQAALDKQRKADNIISVMSGDEIRALPNANAAEAAARRALALAGVEREVTGLPFLPPGGRGSRRYRRRGDADGRRVRSHRQDRHRASQGAFRCADGRRADHLGAARAAREVAALRRGQGAAQRR